MNAIHAQVVAPNKLSPGESKLMSHVVEALETWDHNAAKQPWSNLIKSRIRSFGMLDDIDIKLLIWQAIQKACLTCASKREEDYLRLVEDLGNDITEVDLESLESQNTLDKEQQLAQMVFTISKKLYDAAIEVAEKVG